MEIVVALVIFALIGVTLSWWALSPASPMSVEEAQAQTVLDRDDGPSMTWVVDTENPGKVKLAVRTPGVSAPDVDSVTSR